MHNTKNDLPINARKSVCDFLQKRLADGIDLLQQVKQAHWNIKGPHFIALHKLFDEIHEEVERSVDQIAERIVQLGGEAEGTCEQVIKSTSMPKYPVAALSEEQHLAAISSSFSFFGKVFRAGIVTVQDQWKDDVTADLMVQVSKLSDKCLWLVESHSLGELRSQVAKLQEFVA